MTSYEYARFTAADAHALNDRLVTVTTHKDPETEQPGETHGPLWALHVGTKPYLMLLPDKPDLRSEDCLFPTAVVFLADVATVTIH